MNKQPEAMRLADALERGTYLLYIERDNTATELRRLHEVNAELLKTMRQLACLGMGDRYGNSDGNIVAQVALNKATGESA